MNKLNDDAPTDSPCIGICSTAIGDEICIGCGRTFDEVNNWNSLPDQVKIKINQRLQKNNDNA